MTGRQELGHGADGPLEDARIECIIIRGLNHPRRLATTPTGSCKSAEQCRSTMFRRLLKTVLGRLVRPTEQQQTPEQLIERLRARGVRIGSGCEIYTDSFSTEPYLVTIGNRVAISGGTKFITHDGAAWLLRPQRPNLQFLGEIEIGDETYVGEDCIILAGARIGRGCIVAAGSVVRGRIPENSLVAGNPGRVIGRASLLLEILAHRRGAIESFNLREPERTRVILERFGREGAAQNMVSRGTGG
jgi:acetyltransferase-like isoleucine patch superfamily enzyme